MSNYLQTLAHFTDFKSHHGREISKDKNQKTVQNHLNLLQKMHILESTMQGRNKIFNLNLKYPLTKKYLIQSEYQKLIDIAENNYLIKELIEITKDLKGITIIFGSYVNNTQTKKSDIDILNIGTSNKPDFKNFPKKIQFLQINPKDFQISSKNPFIDEVIQKHIIIKGVEDFIDLVQKERSKIN